MDKNKEIADSVRRGGLSAISALIKEHHDIPMDDNVGRGNNDIDLSKVLISPPSNEDIKKQMSKTYGARNDKLLKSISSATTNYTNNINSTPVSYLKYDDTSETLTRIYNKQQETVEKLSDIERAISNSNNDTLPLLNDVDSSHSNKKEKSKSSGAIGKGLGRGLSMISPETAMILQSTKLLTSKLLSSGSSFLGINKKDKSQTDKIQDIISKEIRKSTIGTDEVIDVLSDIRDDNTKNTKDRESSALENRSEERIRKSSNSKVQRVNKRMPTKGIGARMAILGVAGLGLFSAFDELKNMTPKELALTALGSIPGGRNVIIEFTKRWPNIKESLDEKLDVVREKLSTFFADISDTIERTIEKLKTISPKKVAVAVATNVPGGKAITRGAITTNNVVRKALGHISARFESKDDVSTVSSGRGDPGGVSYGTHQLSSNAGTMQKWMESEGKELSQKYGLKKSDIGTRSFNNIYKKMANENEELLRKSQHDFISRTHYQPVLEMAKAKGFSVENEAIQEALWSQSVQHSRKGNKAILDMAPMSKDVSSQLEALKSARSNYVIDKSGLPTKTLSSVLSRYDDEYNKLQMISSAPVRSSVLETTNARLQQQDKGNKIIPIVMPSSGNRSSSNVNNNTSITNINGQYMDLGVRRVLDRYYSHGMVR